MHGHEVPARAQVVIVGGGVVGTAVAYQLARRGWTDVVLLEQNTLTSGTTWHAAGLITQARPTHGWRAVVKRSVEIFRSLESDTGFSTGYVEMGTIHLAMSADRLEELRHQQLASISSGIEVRLLDPEETVALHPLLNPEGVHGSLFYPHEGRGGASDTTMSLARGATQRGAIVLEGVEVTGVMTAGGRVTGVQTTRGEIEAEFVVNATGMWGRQFGELAGVRVPLQALAHYYIVTDAIDGLQRNLPTIKSADDCSYVKDEAGALMVGFFEPGSYAWASAGIPRNEGFIRLPEDWDHLGPFYERMIERLPILADAGIKLHFSGPEAFTPDGFYHLGPAPLLPNYFVAAGFNSTGFLTGPGAGAVLADWIVDGRPPIVMPEVDPARVQPHETNRRFLEARVVETLDRSYGLHWPFEQRTSARPLRTSPLYEQTKAAGAVFGQLIGWERPNWYATGDADRDYAYSFGRPNWFEASGQEHRAVREAVGMFDTSSFGKLLVQGRDALAVLQRLSIRQIDVPIGRVIYTQWLNEFAGIEADVTVTRLAESEFMVLSGPGTVLRDLAKLRRAIGPEENCTVADITGSMAMISVMGPHSRAMLQPLTDADLSNEAFPFATSREIDLGFGFVRATRLTFVGELGWELLVPTDLARHIFEVLLDAGEPHGLRMAGYYAMNSLRLEKAYRSWGHDIASSDDPYGAGLAFAVAWDKPGGFVGRDALARIRETGVDRRLMQFVLTDPEPMLFHDEPVYRDGVMVGRVEATQYGYTLGGAVALGWVQAPGIESAEWFEQGSYEIQVPEGRVRATASLRPQYDPTSARVKA
jgi:4-methylaminobutanoate oxidase (formaldehyde-forming)